MSDAHVNPEDAAELGIDVEQLTDSKIYGFLRLLLPAGAETTFRVMGNCLYALLSHPVQHFLNPVRRAAKDFPPN